MLEEIADMVRAQQFAWSQRGEEQKDVPAPTLSNAIADFDAFLNSEPGEGMTVEEIEERIVHGLRVR